jgi:arginyl-tRNA synthetase
MRMKTMLRLGVEYDAAQESEILRLQFWASAFELLQERGAIHYEDQGKNAGCWVMPAAAFSEGSEDDKVIVRSNGTVTYVGKDIAYQLWKFGLLGKDFYYRPLHKYADGRVLWVTTNRPPDTNTHIRRSGKATRVYNVIDVRQSYLQDVVVAGLRALGFDQQAGQSIHFPTKWWRYHRCCANWAFLCLKRTASGRMSKFRGARARRESR